MWKEEGNRMQKEMKSQSREKKSEELQKGTSNNLRKEGPIQMKEKIPPSERMQEGNNNIV